MANYDDWSSEFQGVWDELPGIPFFRDYEREQAEDLFDSAFVDQSLSRAEREQAREDFFDFTGLPEYMFPWEDWKEAMGYGDD